MATELTAGTLTVTLTEALTITHATTADNRSHNQTITASFSAIDNIDTRVLTLSTTAETTVATLGAAEGLGLYVRSSVKYIRITNLDNTVGNFILVGIKDDGGDTAYFKIPGDNASFILADTGVEANTSGAAFSALSNVDSIILKANATGTQCEIVVATTD